MLRSGPTSPKSALLLFVSVVIVIVTLWFQRHIFFHTYDPDYMHEYYSFSQWALPLSSRIMGDGDLYAYSGYSLTNELKPFSINPETPILAKLFFGYSVQLFGNQHIASVVFLALLILGMDTLAKQQFQFSKNKRILLAVLIFTSAEIQEQFKTTLLDLPQVMLFVWHLVFLFKVGNSKISNSAINQFKNLSIAGILLGFMTASKLGLYTPFILLADLWYLYKNKQLSVRQQVKFSLVLAFTSIIGYLLPYVPVLFSDGIISFLKAQKWTVNFYLSSVVSAPMGMLVVTAFTGFYKGWSNSNWEKIQTWNGEWGLGLVFMCTYLGNWIRTKKIKNAELGAILLTLTAIVLLLLKIPFWPRYFVFFIPFFWLFVLDYFKNEKVLLLLFLFPVISTVKLISHSYQTPSDYLLTWNAGAYEELYNYFSSSLKKETTRSEFVASNLREYEQIYPNEIRTEIAEEYRTETEIKQVIYVKLFGHFGRNELKKEITWSREYAQWKISQLETISRKVETNHEPENVTCVNPVKVVDWANVYSALGDYYDTVDLDANKHIMQLIPRDYCIPYAPAYNLDYNFPEGIEILKNQNEYKQY